MSIQKDIEHAVTIMRGKHEVKIQGVIFWAILKIFCSMMIIEKLLCFEDTVWTKFATNIFDICWNQ